MVPQHPRQAQRPSLSWTACSGRRISERHSARERQPVPTPARRRGARTSPGRWQERCAWCPSTRDRLSAHRSAGLLAQAGGHLSGTLRASGSQCRCQPGAGERAPARGAGRRGAHGAPAPATGSAPATTGGPARRRVRPRPAAPPGLLAHRRAAVPMSLSLEWSLLEQCVG